MKLGKILGFVLIVIALTVVGALLKEGGIAVFSIIAVIVYFIYKGMFPKTKKS